MKQKRSPHKVSPETDNFHRKIKYPKEKNRFFSIKAKLHQKTKAPKSTVKIQKMRFLGGSREQREHSNLFSFFVRFSLNVIKEYFINF